jgi:tetratricopeptide (TPR) repeat protein
MFAQLEPPTQANAGHAPQTQPMGAQEPFAQEPAETHWPEALADAFEWPSQPGAQSAARGQGIGYSGPDMTLEALEDAHTSSGFQPLTLEPGTLAAFTGNDPRGGAAPGETTRALDDFFQGPEEPQPAPLPEPEPQAPTPTIAPTDYPARLAQARSLREAGALDEALVEYRALLKNAPNLLPDVLSDLESSLDEQPDHPEIHRLLGDARIRQGDYMAALESLNRSVSLTQNPDD